MSDRALRRTASVTAALTVLVATALLLSDIVLARHGFDELVANFSIYAYLLALSFSAVGMVIVRRFPRHALAWIYLLIGAGVLGGGFHAYAEWAYTQAEVPAGAVAASWLGAWLWFPSIGLFLTFALLLFPDGRLPSRRWLPVAVAAVTGIAVNALDFAAGAWRLRGPRVLDASDSELSWLPRWVTEPAAALLFLAAAAGVASLVVRYRGADRDRRHQLKWVIFAGVVTVVVLVANILTTTRTEAGGTIWIVLVAPLIPVATAIAIARYRLYDIDVVINRALVVGLLGAFISAVYVAIVVGVGTLAGARTDDPGAGLALVATVVVAVAFQPARERARRLANRLVYGDRATPYEVMAEFSERVSEVIAIEDVLPRMAEAVAQAVGATRVRVAADLPEGGRRSVDWPEQDGTGSGSPEPTWDHTVAVAHQGETVGEIAVAAPSHLSADDLRLLEDLGAQAGLALRSVALNSELEARLDDITEQAREIRASRQRIVAAQDAERRRMERDIHDGAQQQLVAMSVKLGLLEQLVDRDGERAVALLDELGQDANAALEGLRDLARGIFPPLLAEQGLVAALDAHIRKHALSATVVADPSVVEGRFGQDIEVAVYFCCLEALQNASKHAPASPVVVTLGLEGDALRFTIADHGPGFEATAVGRGAGLQNMADRVAALAGELEIDSEPGSGTTVRGRIPLGSR